MLNLQEAISVVSGEKQQQIFSARSMLENRFPITIQALRLIDKEYTAVKKHKGYNLIERKNKKMGFVYYVRYYHKGKMLSTKWCTHTNSYENACLFAEKNRETLISTYLYKTGGYAIRLFKQFFDINSETFQNECRRNGKMGESRRKKDQTVINDKFIPFLKEKKIESFEEITVPVLDDFQDYLIRDRTVNGIKVRGVKTQTANDNMAAVNKIFNYLMRKGIITSNPCKNLVPLPERKEDKKTHGCYELEKMKGVFNKRWKDKTAYLLNLIVYTTDMRPIEIRRFCKNDIINILGCHFIDLKESKTENGIRLVPLHNKVLKKILEYAEGMENDKNIFEDISWYQFTKAYKALGEILGKSKEFLKEENITFYSGRHFWKTLMSAAGLGEGAEECFMGHKVTNDVAKLYNHRDRQGKKNLVKKAREVFKILDTWIFIQRKK